MKYIKSYKIFEGWEDAAFENNKAEYEQALGVNVFDMIVKINNAGSEFDKYEEIFKHIDDSQLKSLITKYATMEEFASSMIYDIAELEIEVPDPNHPHRTTTKKSKGTQNVDYDNLDEILTYIWGNDWFDAMVAQEFKEKRGDWNHTTNSLIIIFEDTISNSELASAIVYDIMEDKAVLESEIESNEEYWSEHLGDLID